MVKGIKNQKGRVHLHICNSIERNFNTLEELAGLIDDEIISNYKLWPSNYIAGHALGIITKESSDLENKEISFLKRFKGVDSEIRKKVLKMYAAPLVNSKQRAQTI